jgi:cytochrome d ubiquinol oxidase subunit I
MQEPVGYALEAGRAEMTDFLALLANPHLWVQFPHVFFSGLTTAAFFVLGLSAYHLIRKGPAEELFRRSFRWALALGTTSALLVGMVGHTQAQHMIRVQPMKMAAAEALWESENPASLSLFTIGDERGRRDLFAIRIPRLLSFLAHNRLTGEVKGIKNLEAEYQATYGPGDYAPPIAVSYWAFRIMIGSGVLMLALAAYGLYQLLRGRQVYPGGYLRLLPWSVGLPYLANTAGWILTEVGRQPWIVFGLQRTEEAVSPNVSAGSMLFSLLAFALIYAALIAADIYLLSKHGRAAPDAGAELSGHPA